jgi:hypothetical protein
VIGSASNINDFNVINRRDCAIVQFLNKDYNSSWLHFAVERQFIAGNEILAVTVMTCKIELIK